MFLPRGIFGKALTRYFGAQVLGQLFDPFQLLIERFWQLPLVHVPDPCQNLRRQPRQLRSFNPERIASLKPNRRIL
jgi:hypothetical protein